MDAEALVRPVIEQAGFEFVELASTREHGRKVLRVVVDRPGGVDLDALSQLSATVSRHLDQEGYEDGPYGLEVSSPGIERPLKRPEHFARSVGEQRPPAIPRLILPQRPESAPFLEPAPAR